MAYLLLSVKSLAKFHLHSICTHTHKLGFNSLCPDEAMVSELAIIIGLGNGLLFDSSKP